jgi:hypothetical protein
MDMHQCSIIEYSRYPYKSASGQEPSKRQIECLEKTGHFDKIYSEEAEKVQQDARKGVWSPLRGRIEGERVEI